LMATNNVDGSTHDTPLDDGSNTSNLQDHNQLNFPQQIPSREKERRNRKRKSEIWEWFVLVDNNNSVKCSKCGWSIKYSGSTSGCHEHQKKCSGIQAAKLERVTNIPYNPSEISWYEEKDDTGIMAKKACHRMNKPYIMDANELVQVRHDIVATKSKLYQAESTGLTNLIRVYGDLLIELQRKENLLRYSVPVNNRSRAASFESVVFILGYISSDGLTNEPMGTAFCISSRHLLTASSNLPHYKMDPEFAAYSLSSGRYVVSKLLRRGGSTVEFESPRTVRLLRGCDGAEGWAILELVGGGATAIVDSNGNNSSGGLNVVATSQSSEGELGKEDDCGFFFFDYLSICPAELVPQPCRESGCQLSLHYAPLDWLRRVDSAPPQQLTVPVQSMTVWSSFHCQVLQLDGPSSSSSAMMISNSGSSPADGKTRLLLQGGCWLGSAGAPMVNESGQVVAMQLCSYRDSERVAVKAEVLQDETDQSSISSSVVVCVGLLLSSVPEIAEWVQAGQVDAMF